ncbi:DUF885 family protein [Stieleria tagensis]|uniref:DUF885 family protein n=1 Tax=Stieleria tagensis TaxID=2956795 RepID=UPI00209A9E4C|nr:DUF885 family protein [Stieleria tagensis]
MRWQLAKDLYNVDRNRLMRRFPIRISAARLIQMDRYLDAWQSALVVAQPSGEEDETAIAELRSQIDEHQKQLGDDQNRRIGFLSTYSFAQPLIKLVDVDQRGRPIDFAQAARQIDEIDQSLQEQTDSLDCKPDADNPLPKSELNPIAVELINAYQSWMQFYADYNPRFDWWLGDSSNQLADHLTNWAQTVPQELPATEGSDEQLVDHDESSFPVILDSDYPPVSELLTGAAMPAVMLRFRDDIRAARKDPEPVLRSWQQAVREIQIAGNPFADWCRDDQIDFHRLQQDIAMRLSILDDKSEPAIAISREDDDLDGTIVGPERLATLLRGEFIDHTPQELIQLAEQEYLICRAEMIAAAQQMGFGDDWQSAVEQIKNQSVAPGEQPQLIRTTAEQSIQWIRDHDLLSIDRLAEFTWRMKMMSPQRQRVNPFFTGGEVISVSFPTRQMTQDDKRQSLRGNNPAFARATVHHELIPGHHYQNYQCSRFQPHRRSFGTPFWLEGWAVYWEFVLYEGGFARTPEERLGFLVWRAHRYARILFSLKFHLGKLTPDQCVAFLIDNVGFDRRNATAEVRRSIGPDYPPLYQAAYMLGAMQFRQLAERWTAEGRGTKKQFHDAVLRLGQMPIALLQSRLFDEPISRDQPPMWRFNLDG